MDPIADILATFDAAKNYENTKGKPISHKFFYRSTAGRLNGYDGDESIQTFEESIEYSDAGNQVPMWNKIAEISIATMMERYDIAGPFHQYPKTYFVGPTQFDTSGIIRHVGSKVNPFVRDVDRIIWLKNIYGTEQYYFGFADFLNSDMTKPGTLQMEVIVVQSKSAPARTAAIDANRDIEAIIRECFVDGKAYVTNLKRTDRTTSQRSNQMYKIPVLPLLWIMKFVGANRYFTVDKIDPPLEENDVLKMLGFALIGHMSYLIPKDEDQREYPVPIGKITVEKLLLILREVVIQKTFVANKSKLKSNPVDVGFYAALSGGMDTSSDDSDDSDIADISDSANENQADLFSQNDQEDIYANNAATYSFVEFDSSNDDTDLQF